jgi:hypothetical protein
LCFFRVCNTRQCNAGSRDTSSNYRCPSASYCMPDGPLGLSLVLAQRVELGQCKGWWACWRGRVAAHFLAGWTACRYCTKLYCARKSLEKLTARLGIATYLGRYLPTQHNTYITNVCRRDKPISAGLGRRIQKPAHQLSKQSVSHGSTASYYWLLRLYH